MWEHVVGATLSLGGRAWLFSLPPANELFTEFVEWPADGERPIIERDPLRQAWTRLNEAFPSEESDTWQQAGS